MLFKIKLTIRQKRLFLLLISLVISYSLVVPLGGKFWTYHWIVVSYIFSLILSLIIFTPKKYEKIRLFILIVTLMFTLFNIQNFKYIRYIYQYGKWGTTPKDGMVDEVAKFLKENLKKGDTVQPIDWSTGAIHSMLLAEAKIATKYMYDYHFYHHIDSDVNKFLRKDFIKKLKIAKPKYIIYVPLKSKAYPTGKNSSTYFKELETIINNNYTMVKKGVKYEIYQNNIFKTN